MTGSENGVVRVEYLVEGTTFITMDGEENTLRRFGIAGTPNYRERPRALLEALPQLSQVAIVPATAPGQRVADVAARFIEEVVRDAAPDIAGREV